MSWLTDFRTAVAQATADESGGLLTFRPQGAYRAGELGIYGVVLPEAPDDAVSLSAATISEDVETVMRATFRYRSRTEVGLDVIGDALADSWTKRPAGTLGSVRIIMAQWASGASLGQDSNNRLLRSANFYITVSRPLRNRT